MRPLAAIGAVLVAGSAAVLGEAVTPTLSTFSRTAESAGNVFAAAPDWQAPTAGATVIAKTTGGAGGAIKPGATYYVYANVADAGNPPSGTAGVTSDVAAITSGQTAAALGAGTYAVNGVAYTHRSASLTAGALAGGSYAYTLTSADALAYTRTQSGFSVTVDATAPSGTDIQPINRSGGTANTAEIADVIVYTFSEPMDPNSIQVGWTGASQNVVVRLTNGGGGDRLTVYNAANNSQLALGSVNLASRLYTRASRTFGAAGTPSTMVMNGDTVTVTLGTSSGTTGTAVANATAVWTPSATATDIAENAMHTTVVTESGTPDGNL